MWKAALTALGVVTGLLVVGAAVGHANAQATGSAGGPTTLRLTPSTAGGSLKIGSLGLSTITWLLPAGATNFNVQGSSTNTTTDAAGNITVTPGVVPTSYGITWTNADGVTASYATYTVSN